MLKRIIFILKKEDAMQEMEMLLKELAKYQVEAYIFKSDGSCMEEIEEIGIKEIGEIEIGKKGIEKIGTEEWLPGYLSAEGKEALYVTDCAACQKKLQARKLPVIVYLHGDNRGEDFSHAEYAIENLREIELQSLELAYLRLVGKPWDITETERCKIRETTVEDVDSFYEIYKEPSITEYMEDLYTEKEEELAYIRDYIKNVYGFYGYGMWTVLEKADGRIIGRAGITLREGSDIPELGFVIGVPWQRQGYAYEVCQAILTYGQEELGFTRFQTLIMEGNENSKRLCGKLGFVYREKVQMDGVEYERMVRDCYDKIK